MNVILYKQTKIIRILCTTFYKKKIIQINIHTAFYRQKKNNDCEELAGTN